MRTFAIAFGVAIATLLWSGLSLSDLDGPARAPGAAVQAIAYTNPVLNDDFPDPSVIRAGGEYWMTATSSWNAPGFPLMRSPDLVHWTPAGMIFGRLPGWAADSFWAPELFQDDARFLVYYTARRRGGPLCVAVADAPAPTGPWTDHGPLVCQPDGSIDPTRTTDSRGRPYLVWKEDGNSRGEPTRLWAKRLRRDGLGLIGPRHELLRDDERWEGGIVEAPELVRRDGWLYLFFSGNTCCSPPCRYAEGVARSRSLFGPWQRSPHNPILRRNRAWTCPGHGSVAQAVGGRDYLLYHAYPNRDRTYARRFGLLDRIDWGADGWPSVNSGRGPSVVGAVFVPQ